MPVFRAILRFITRTLLLTLLIVQPMKAAALTVEGVTFQESVSIHNKQIPIRGAALLRWLNIFKVYVAALYLPESDAPNDALADIPKRLEISYLVSIPGPDFGKGAEAILERNNSPEALARLRGRIDQLNAVYRDVKPGDRYALTYVPGQGTELSYNGQPLITIQGADFAAAYFGIWLGKDPIDLKMRSRLINEG
ncbi:chalcone isomerase family protein [Desulfobulbus propionicus]